MTADAKTLLIAGKKIGRGKTVDVELQVSQGYSGQEVGLPVRVLRGPKRGPVLLLTAAVHGDELNGTGIIRELAMAPPFELLRGSLILVPVVNILGFERGTRYLPDRRDLNRCFPGIAQGSLSSRVAHTVFNELIRKADYCVDFHTAAVHRTNFPNVRANLAVPEIERLAKAFGSPLIINHPGIKKSLRLEASKAGHFTIILEAGGVSKVEPAVVELGVRGVSNVLLDFDMIAGERAEPAYQAVVDDTKWLRADRGGLLRFHGGPGDPVEKDQAIASVTSLMGRELDVLVAPRDGIIVGITTLPAVKPGDPVCHLGFPRKGIRRIQKTLGKLPDESLHERLRSDLGSSVAVEPGEAPEKA